jgi:hypothetical protein
MSTLESIRFDRDALAQSSGAAQVVIETVARHTDRVDHCQGTLGLVRAAGGARLISGANVMCSDGARRAGAVGAVAPAVAPATAGGATEGPAGARAGAGSATPGGAVAEKGRKKKAKAKAAKDGEDGPAHGGKDGTSKP